MTVLDDAQAILQTLYDLQDRGSRFPSGSDVIEASGMEVDPAEKAIKWLGKQGYITGTAAWGGTYLRMETTAKGDQAIESGHTLAELQDPQSGDMQVNFSSDGGTINSQVGNNNEQNVTIGVSPAELQNLISALRDAGATDAADQVDQVTRGGTDVSGARKALEIAVSVLSGAASMASVGTAITAIL